MTESEIKTKILEKTAIIFSTLEKELNSRFTGYAFVPERAKAEVKLSIQGAIVSGYKLAQEALQNGKT